MGIEYRGVSIIVFQGNRRIFLLVNISCMGFVTTAMEIIQQTLCKVRSVIIQVINVNRTVFLIIPLSSIGQPEIGAPVECLASILVPFILKSVPDNPG